MRGVSLSGKIKIVTKEQEVVFVYFLVDVYLFWRKIPTIRCFNISASVIEYLNIKIQFATEFYSLFVILYLVVRGLDAFNQSICIYKTQRPTGNEVKHMNLCAVNGYFKSKYSPCLTVCGMMVLVKRLAGLTAHWGGFVVVNLGCKHKISLWEQSGNYLEVFG